MMRSLRSLVYVKTATIRHTEKRMYRTRQPIAGNRYSRGLPFVGGGSILGMLFGVSIAPKYEPIMTSQQSVFISLFHAGLSHYSLGKNECNGS